MSKWSVLRHLIDNGNVDMAMHGLSEAAFIKLVEDAEKAEQRGTTKPKTIVEEIWEALREENIGTLIRSTPLAMALAEAVEFMELYRKGYKPGGWDGNAFEAQSSILAILKGYKQREIPKL